MSSPLETVLSKIPSAKKSGVGYLGRCPTSEHAHGDRKPGLSIGEGSDGRVLLKCHKGCSLESILSALGLSESDLFQSKDKPEIEAVYPYTDEEGKLLYEVVRYRPKDFRQRRPDGSGGWIWNLTGVRRVLFRLKDLAGSKAIVVAEGEKDVNRLWALGIPATTNAGGAGKWLDVYSEQLKQQGVERAAILRDNDEIGQHHREVVARSCSSFGLQVRAVELPGLPPKGDVSDYLAAGHDLKDLQALIKRTPLWSPTSAAASRTFAKVGQRHYRLSIMPEDIIFDLEKVARHDRSWWGQLGVRVNGSCPEAKLIIGTDNLISESDFNLTSDAARDKRAKSLAERSGNNALDWLGYVEQLSVMALRAEREGSPVVDLAENEAVEISDEDRSVWTFEGFPLLQRLPQVLFGDSANGKSYFAMWLAGCLALEGINVLYCDWEFSHGEHEKRLARLFQPRPRGIKYLKCEQPMEDEIDRIQRIVEQCQCRFIICDSVGFAIRGAAEYQEGATGYFNALRRLEIGSLNIAHIPKQRDEAREAEIYGNSFFKHGARSIWFIQRASQESSSNEIQFGLFHRKYNLGRLHTPLGYALTFEEKRTRIRPTEVAANEELATGLPLKDRMMRSLKRGPLTVTELAQELNITGGAIRVLVARHPSVFIRQGRKIDLVQSSMAF